MEKEIRMKLEDLKPGAVVVEERGGFICVVMEIRAGACPVIYARGKVAAGLYKGRPEDFKAVVGQVDLAALKAMVDEAREDKATGYDDLPFAPEALKGLKIGDVINVRVGASVEKAIYKGYHPGRPRFPVSFELNGRNYKSPVQTVVGKAA